MRFGGRDDCTLADYEYNSSNNAMKVVILAGGLGTRISEESYLKPKPMIEIGGKPILWHIMKIYSAHGANDFVICCGYKGYVIKEYFANYFLHMSDITFDMADNTMVVHQSHAEPWRVTLVDTGENTQTGGRLKRVAEHIKDEEAFCFTYGDGISNLNIRSSIDFHRSHGKLATVTAVLPPGRLWRIGAFRRSGHSVHREAARRRRHDQRRLFRPVAAMPRSDRGRRQQLGRLAHHPARRHGTDDGLRAPRLLAADGYDARQGSAGRAVGIRQGAVENLAIDPRHRCRVLARQARPAHGPFGLQGLMADALAASAGRRGDGHQPAANDDAQPFLRGQSRCMLQQPVLRYSRCVGARRRSSKQRGRRSYSIWRRSRWCGRATASRAQRSTPT